MQFQFLQASPKGEVNGSLWSWEFTVIPIKMAFEKSFHNAKLFIKTSMPVDIMWCSDRMGIGTERLPVGPVLEPSGIGNTMTVISERHVSRSNLGS